MEGKRKESNMLAEVCRKLSDAEAWIVTAAQEGMEAYKLFEDYLN